VILCLGEAIVDLVCERELDSIDEADAFAPRFGGALANVAVAASRAGAGAGLAGGVGDDAWGRWLHSRLEAEGIDLRWFSLIAGLQTPIAFVTFDRAREPSFQIYGQGIEAGIRAVAGRIDEAVEAASALVFGSNTLVGEPERELTVRARALALEQGVPELFDPNIREHRWPDPGTAVTLSRQVCADASVVRANRAEAAAIAGFPPGADPIDAADALHALGARVAVVTLGPGGAVVRGEAAGEVAAAPVEVVSPLGAGDAFMGALAAGLAARGWELGRADEALPEAVEAGSRACETWGAIA
jgi:sugar/nucleoside kinase (ribokinase family)